MLRYTLSRLVSLAISLTVASVVIFLVIEILPGDPAVMMLGVNAQEDTLAALRDQLGLNGSMIERYFSWVGGMLTGDFGTSYTYRTPVAEMVGDRLWISLPLAIYALTLSTLIAFPAGIWAASRRGSAVDVGVMGITQLGVAIPNFWFAMLMVVVFAVNLRWFNAGGFPGWDKGFWLSIKALTLPAVALALPQASILARVMRVCAGRHAWRGFRAHGTGQGLVKTASALAACAAQCLDPGADDHRDAVRLFAGGRDHYRKRVLSARPWSPDFSVDLGP
jgi:peptide/nickel transport system permease protein